MIEMPNTVRMRREIERGWESLLCFALLELLGGKGVCERHKRKGCDYNKAKGGKQHFLKFSNANSYP